MKPSAPTILVAAPPGPLRTALQALLSSLPGAYTIHTAELPAQWLEILSSGSLDLVILTGEALAKWNGSLQDLQAAAPSVPIAVMVDDAAQTPLDLQAAKAILQQGAPPGELVATLERLLSEHRA